MSNIAVYIINQLKKHNRDCAIQHANYKYSGNEFINLILNIGQHLLINGVKASDVVAIELHSPMDALAGSLAIGLIGATSILHPPSAPQEKIKNWAKRVNTKWILHDQEAFKLEEEDYTYISIKDLRIDVNVMTESIAIKDPNSPWLIANGSGSTGDPKLMPISHLQQIERCKISKSWAPYNNNEVFASLVGCHFYMGISRHLECLTIGAKSQLNNSISDLHQSDETTIIYGTPYHIQALLRIKKTNPSLLVNLKSIIISGDLVSKELRREANKKLNANIFVLYGCHETYSCCIACPPTVYEDSELIGKSIDGFTIEIVDKKHNRLPNNVMGQIRIKSKCSITQYLNDQQQNLQVFHDGYVYPGDLGFFDELDQLHFKGRQDGMMIFNGINIYPQEIQKCLLSHPNVKDVATTSFKHKIHGDLPIVFVELSDPKTQTSERELKSFGSTKLGNYHIHKLIVVKKMPRDDRGKLPKEKLKKLAENYIRKNKQSNYPLSIEKVILGRHLESGRFALSIPENSEIEVRNSCQSLNLILGTSIKPLPTSTDPTMKMAVMACELTSIFLEEANIPHSTQPTLIPVGSSKEQKQIYILSFHQFPNGFEQIFISIMKLAHNILCSLRVTTITKQQSQKLRESIKKQIHNLIKASKSRGYGKSSSKLIKCAEDNGTPFIFRKNSWIQYGWGNQSITMLRSSISSDSEIGARASTNKFEAAQLLRESGFPVPKHFIAPTRESAFRIAKSIKNWPVVIKPIDGDRGEGVTTGVASEADVLKAFDYASKNGRSKRVLIEETIPGTCHRIFIANGKLIYCVKRKPIGITGNGMDPIEKIILTKNQLAQATNSYKITDPQPRLDQIALETLKNSGLTPSTIPALGEFVALRPIETTAWGGIDDEYTDQIHEDNINLAIEASRCFHLSICGVDMISKDISVPWHQNGAKINEINFSPVIGGGEASIRTIPKLFKTLLRSKGVIPIHIFVGANNAYQKAKQKFDDLIENQAEGVYFIDARTIKGPDNKPIHQARSSLYNNLSRCLMNQHCSKIIAVIKDNDILWTGLPINQCESIDICDTKLYSNNNPNNFASNVEYEIVKREILSLKH